MKKQNFIFYVNLFLLCVSILILVTGVYEHHQAKIAEEEIGEAVNMLSENLTLIDNKLTELDIIYQTAEEYNLEPELILAMIKVESNFDKYAVSDAGCAGYMQINPIHNVANVFDLETNITFGTSYLSYLLSESKNIHEALGKYNRGKTGYKNYCKNTNQNITEYSAKIMNYVNDLNGTAD